MSIPELVSAFEKPSRNYAIQPIVHEWTENIQDMVDALVDFGCRGAVLNCPFKDGFTSNSDNLEFLGKVMDAMDAAGLKYWLYDEQGYPSGTAGGLTLKDHPEYEARGLYMRRYVTYEEPKTIHFRLDDQSDKIVWAAKYTFTTPGIHHTVIDYESMAPVPFTKTEVDVTLQPCEAFFVFCVKCAYEGSECTHNVCSFRHYINIMDKAAVRHFIDVAYEPVKAVLPDAYRRAEAVFTDEPSLQVFYVRKDEVWPYALAPWVDGLLERFEARYGFSLKPYLPLIFEGAENAYPYRRKFYQLVGEIIAEAYSGQLREWCANAGGVFSGHYLCEEWLPMHVVYYGNYFKVLTSTGYPGIDELFCVPEDYHYSTVLYPRMAARKMGASGMMAEICPFINTAQFNKAPLDNMTGVMGLLYLGGVRITNSYFEPDFQQWKDGRIKRRGSLGLEDALWFNQYVARLGTMLDGLQNQCDVFIYCNLEEAQATWHPTYSLPEKPARSIDDETARIADAVYEAGNDFYYVDADDVIGAAAKPEISGNAVRTLIVPNSEVMESEVLAVLAKWQAAGVEVLFVDQLPKYTTDVDNSAAALTATFRSVSARQVLDSLAARTDSFRIICDNAIVLQGRFTMKDGAEMHMLVNKSRNDAQVTCIHPSASSAKLFNPVDGSVSDVSLETPLIVPSLRAAFLVFDRLG